jgi:hypothetical protein
MGSASARETGTRCGLVVGANVHYEALTLALQLADTDSKVALVALSVLDEAADDSACLDSIIKKGCFEQLVNFPEMSTTKYPEKGNNLLMRFLSRSSGFKYVRSSRALGTTAPLLLLTIHVQLSTTTYIETELKEWRTRKFIDYVNIVETPLREAFAAPVWRRNFEKYARSSPLLSLLACPLPLCCSPRASSSPHHCSAAPW